LCALCVVSYRSVSRPYHSSGGVLMNLACLRVIMKLR
jgi:hypothetical protein